MQKKNLTDFLSDEFVSFEKDANTLKTVLTEALNHENSHRDTYESKPFRTIKNNNLKELVGHMCETTRCLATPTPDEFNLLFQKGKAPYSTLNPKILDIEFRSLALRLRDEFGTYKRIRNWPSAYQKLFDINSIAQNMVYIAHLI